LKPQQIEATRLARSLRVVGGVFDSTNRFASEAQSPEVADIMHLWRCYLHARLMPSLARAGIEAWVPACARQLLCATSCGDAVGGSRHRTAARRLPTPILMRLRDCHFEPILFELREPPALTPPQMLQRLAAALRPPSTTWTAQLHNDGLFPSRETKERAWALLKVGALLARRYGHVLTEVWVDGVMPRVLPYMHNTCTCNVVGHGARECARVWGPCGVGI